MMEYDYDDESPNLMAPDFLLCGMLRARVYQTCPVTIKELKTTIQKEVAMISQRELQKVMSSVLLPVNKCIACEDGHLEDILSRNRTFVSVLNFHRFLSIMIKLCHHLCNYLK
jgi:hypothetical protein